MPEIGEIRKVKDIEGYANYPGRMIWIACEDCGKERWVQYKGKPSFSRCQRCKNIARIKPMVINQIPPVLGEVRMGRNIGFKVPSGRYQWSACGACGFERWVRLNKAQPRAKICKVCKHENTPKGPESPMWKGGRNATGYGYISVRVYSDNPFYSMASKKGKNSGVARFIPEHRLVMARHLGRCLYSWEVVHHKNGKRSDNRIENLELTAHGAHSVMHNKGYKDGYIKGSQDGQNKQIRLLKLEIVKLQNAGSRKTPAEDIYQCGALK